MKKALLAALLLVLGSVVLGATLFREPVARAAAAILPVREQNVDSDGNIKVHEQGTADVNVTAATPITNGASLLGGACGSTLHSSTAYTATTVQLAWTSGVNYIDLKLGDNLGATFMGPAYTGDSGTLAVPLSRPIEFDTIRCSGTGTWTVSWVGSDP